jgi:hypothetical protein
MPEIPPEERWKALVDFVENYSIVGASYRVVYGEPGQEIVPWEWAGMPRGGQESQRWTSEWRKKWLGEDLA